MQGARRATGPAPLREGGGAAMNGKRMHGKRQATGAATGGVLRSAVAAITTSHCNKRINPSADGACKACINGHPQYSPRRPFHPLHTRNPQAIFLRATPPSRRGGMLAHSPFSKYLSTLSRPSSPSTIIPEKTSMRSAGTRRRRDSPPYPENMRKNEPHDV
jgi:hypothetical protein